MARAARRIDMPAMEMPGLDMPAMKTQATDGAAFQASFDFLPEEIRSRHRFGAEDAAEWAQRRARLKLIDRQVISTGSRLAAARLREILRPVEPMSVEPISLEPAPAEADAGKTDRLVQQRAELRELGAALFYFRDETPAMMADEGNARQQRLHPRPLPARYFA